jgi:hypothetical protein
MFLVRRKGEWCTWGQGFYMPSVQQVFPIGTSEEVQLRFMRRLQKRGLVSGCDCGCRGDYTPTENGLILLAEDCLVGEQEFKEWQRDRFSLGY